MSNATIADTFFLSPVKISCPLRRSSSRSSSEKQSMAKSTLNDLSVFDLIQCAYSARCLYVLAKVGVFESLISAPKTLVELNEACKSKKDILEDFLQFAVA